MSRPRPADGWTVQVAERWLPKEIAWRKKHMFRAPIQAVFASFSPRSVGVAAPKGEGAE